MRNMLIVAIALALAFATGGCGLFGAQPGLTTVSYSPEDGFDYESGKEFRLAEGSFTRPDGLSGSFRVEGVEAFEGQMIAAQVQLQQLQQLQMMAGMMRFIEPLLRAGAAAYGIPLPAPAIDAPGVEPAQAPSAAPAP